MCHLWQVLNKMDVTDDSPGKLASVSRVWFGFVTKKRMFLGDRQDKHNFDFRLQLYVMFLQF